MRSLAGNAQGIRRGANKAPHRRLVVAEIQKLISDDLVDDAGQLTRRLGAFATAAAIRDV